MLVSPHDFTLRFRQSRFKSSSEGVRWCTLIARARSGLLALVCSGTDSMRQPGAPQALPRQLLCQCGCRNVSACLVRALEKNDVPALNSWPAVTWHEAVLPRDSEHTSGCCLGLFMGSSTAHFDGRSALSGRGLCRVALVVFGAPLLAPFAGRWALASSAVVESLSS